MSRRSAICSKHWRAWLPSPVDDTCCDSDDCKGAEAVSVSTVRNGPYQKLCLDPSGTLYLLKDDYKAIDVIECNKKPRTLQLVGRVGTARGMVWHDGYVYLTDWM